MEIDFCNSDNDIELFDSENEDYASEDWTLIENGIDNESKEEQLQQQQQQQLEPVKEDDSFIERMKLNDQKAGMEGLDKEKINKIIHEASKGSKFYENEKRKEERVKQRVQEMKKELAKFTTTDKQRALIESRKLLCDIQKEFDFSRTLVHVDMDAFYAAVETRDEPRLKNLPMAVGGNSMLSTSNYLARKFGVRAAMPGFIAKKLCPELVIVPENFKKYRAVSGEIRDIFREYDPNFSPMSLDEAYLDLTDYLVTKREDFKDKNRDDARSHAEVVVEEIRNRIFEKTQLTASAGIAPNLMLSKICSDFNKPNGQYYLEPNRETIEKFIEELPIRKIFGIGRVTEQMLQALDIKKCRDLLIKSDVLFLLFSSTSFSYFMRVAHGISGNLIIHDDRKSMSIERTFSNEHNEEKLLQICRSLCEELACDLKKEDLRVRNVTLKYKLSSFVTRTRSKSIPYSISKEDELFLFAKELLLKEIRQTSNKTNVKFELRLMGVRGSHFYQEPKNSKLKQNTVEHFFTAGAQNNTPIKKKPTQTDGFLEHKEPESQLGTQQPGNVNSEAFEKVPCPVCGILQSNSDLALLNSHIDSCLTKQTIKDLIKEQDSIETKGRSKKRKSTDHSKEINNSKKKTLHSFWKK